MKNSRTATRHSRLCALLLPPLACLALLSCDNSGSSQKSAEKAGSTTSVIPASYFTKERPADVPMLREVKASSQVGDNVRFEARVGGRAKPFVDGIAIFIAADPRLVSCDQRPGDNCSVPYDYCCEDLEAIKAGVATIQIVDDGGKLYPVTAQGQGGIEPLKTVVVEGVVAEKDASGVFVVDTKKVWVGTIPTAPPGAAGEHDGHDHDDHDDDHDH